jgi:ribosomal protein L34E
LNVFDEERREAKNNKEKATAKKQKRKDSCEKAKKELEGIKRASFLYKESKDPKNPTVYDDERQKITADAAKSVEH